MVLASVVTIDVATGGRRTDEAQLRFHHLTLPPEETTRRTGVRVTTIERTLFDIAATGADIRRFAQEAIAKRLTSQRKLKASAAARHRGEPGAPAICKVACEPHTRSDLERMFLRFLRESGLPEPLSNHPVGPYEADCYWPEHELVVEVDEDAHRVKFEEDRARDRYFVASASE